MVFLKQYGELRTGTNYLRALLMLNYSNAVPLMHVLGDKHSAPVAIDELWQKFRDEADAAWKLVTSATFAAPAQTTDAEDGRQLAHMRKLAAPIAEAVESGSLVFVVSTKHPFPWAASLAKHHAWIVPARGGLRMHPIYTEHLIDSCRRCNVLLQLWLNHVCRYRSRSAIVRHEDLLADPFSVLRALAAQFELKQAGPELKALPRPVIPPYWDQDPLSFRQLPFDPEFYQKRDYVNRLSSDLWEIVKREIDWRLMSGLGYLPNGDTSPDWRFAIRSIASS